MRQVDDHSAKLRGFLCAHNSLNVVIDDVSNQLSLLGVCAGFEFFRTVEALNLVEVLNSEGVNLRVL